MNKSIKEIDIILTNFNRHISRLIKLASNIEPNNLDIDRIKRIVSILRSTNPNLILENCIDNMWDNREHIINRDMPFFLSNMEALNEKYIKRDDDHDWIENLVKYVSTKIDKLDESHKIYIWDSLNGMLQEIIKYRIQISDFSK